MSEQLGFIFHKESCIQCHGCEMACKMWRQTERGVSWRRVLNIWQGAYPETTCASLSLSCLHCAEPACAEVCPTGAITKRENDGAVLQDSALCIGCRACLDACPYEVPQFGAGGLMQKCDLCAAEASAASGPPCAATCPTGALELAGLSPRRKKELEAEALAQYLKTK